MTEAPLASIGLDAGAEALYRTVLRFGGETTQTLGQLLGWPRCDVDTQLDRLRDLRLVRVVDELVLAEPPSSALATLARRESRRLVDAQTRLSTARLTVPELIAAHRSGRDGDQGLAGIEVLTAAQTPDAMSRLLVETTGDLWHLRPDQWAVPGTEDIDAVLVQELANGRTSCAVYPVQALEPVQPSLRIRATAGELVRVLPSVPSRLVVFGAEAALLTEEWGCPGGQRLLVRQRAVVLALRELARALWARAVTPPSFVGGSDCGYARPLLQLMAQGAGDEQIARAQAVSVRTVRRRIAALLTELGAQSRFQAGAEAARRGWI